MTVDRLGYDYRMSCDQAGCFHNLWNAAGSVGDSLPVQARNGGWQTGPRGRMHYCPLHHRQPHELEPHRTVIRLEIIGPDPNRLHGWHVPGWESPKAEGLRLTLFPDQMPKAVVAAAAIGHEHTVLANTRARSLADLRVIDWLMKAEENLR